jgi:ribosome-associated translation inhibitor RaiA
MTDPRIAESAAMKLAELSREIDELENGRAALLDRLDRVRSTLMVAGNRTTAMRASFEASSLMDSLDEAEDQLERLSSILVEGKVRPPRGH